ncbi:MAG: hypothetical protein DMF80_03240 [Acidobacteria bacterium]|nr:MAG: hypothetical protein DMF80_03240 [Acidobacteriota bacterium]
MIMRQARLSTVRRTLSALVTLSLIVIQAPLISAQRPEEQIELGVKQVEGGDFDAAVITLDAVARALAADGRRPRELTRAYTYLAIAYLGLSQEQTAKARFLEALKIQPELRLDPREFPPKVVSFFEQVREANGPPASPSPVVSPSPAANQPAAPAPGPATAPRPARKGRSKAVPILVGVAAAAGIGVAVAAGKGNSPAPPPTTLVPPPATLSELSAAVTSPQHNGNILCTDNVIVTVTLTNRARSSVTVTGVRGESRLVSGNCSAAKPFVYPPLTSTVAAGSTATVLSTPLFSGGSGCCTSRSSCGGSCEFQDVLIVVTSAGEVNAGAVGYAVIYQNCGACASAAADGTGCPPAMK